MSVPEYLTAESAAQWVPQAAGLQSKLSVPPRIHKALLAQFLISILPLAPAFLLGHARIGAVASCCITPCTGGLFIFCAFW
jgi:hypothetical protein